jgi:putative transposase
VASWPAVPSETTNRADGRFEAEPIWVYPNVVKGLQVEAPNRCWVADLTYVRLLEGFVYLACLLDVYSRKCVGWSLSRRMDVQLPRPRSGDGIGESVKSLLGGFIIQIGEDSSVGMGMWSACSISEPIVVCRLLDSQPRTPSQKTVKWEEVYLHQYRTFEEAQARLQTFLEDIYNAKRLHSSLDYMPPDEFELKNAMCYRISGLDFWGAFQIILGPRIRYKF